VALAVAVFWAAAETAAGAKVEAAIRRVPPMQSPSEDTDRLLCQTIAGLSESLDGCPDNAEGQATLARLWIGLYRNREFQELCRQEPSKARRSAIWESTSPRSLHERACRLARVGLGDALEGLRQNQLVQETLAIALQHLVLARRAGPLLPDVHLLIAEISVLVTPPGTDQIHVDRASQVASWQPDVLYHCGLLEYQARRWDDALKSWRRSLSLNEKHLAKILRLAEPQLAAPGTVEKLFPPDPGLLIRLAANHFHAEKYTQERSSILDYAAKVISKISIPEGQRRYLGGVVFALQGRFPEAINEYSRAVELNGQETAWRYELAALLQTEGRLAEARQQARLCVAVEPNRPEYRELLQKISLADARKQAAK
jgi:tetratricopeptide (TPR) repeat protein